MHTGKIVPNLWFTADGGSISKIIEYYKNIFSADFESGQIIPSIVNHYQLVFLTDRNY
jgi:hypothetical protein